MGQLFRPNFVKGVGIQLTERRLTGLEELPHHPAGLPGRLFQQLRQIRTATAQLPFHPVERNEELPQLGLLQLPSPDALHPQRHRARQHAGHPHPLQHGSASTVYCRFLWVRVMVTTAWNSRCSNRV